MIRLVSASLMCANLLNLKKDIEVLQSNGIDLLHLDVMDAHFVPNLALGPNILNQIKDVSNVPCDYHLMVDNPMIILPSLNISSEDYVTIHYELHKTIIKESFDYLKSLKCHIGLAINPSTDYQCIESYLDDIDLVLVMLVNPGFAGQSIVEGILDKPKNVKRFLLDNHKDNILVSVDGGVSVERANKLSLDDVNVFVGGTAGLFKKEQDLSDSLKLLKSAIDVTK